MTFLALPHPGPPPAAGSDFGCAAWSSSVCARLRPRTAEPPARKSRSEEHTSELQSLRHLVCRLLLEKKKTKTKERTCYKPSGAVEYRQNVAGECMPVVRIPEFI